MRASRRWAVGGIVVAMVIAGCGGGDDPLTEPTDPTVSTTDATTGSTVPASTSATTGAPATPPPIDLAGTSWNVKDYSQGPGFITNVWKTDVTIAFDDQTVSGSAGCNTYSATWTTSGPYDPLVTGQRDANDGQVIEFSDLAWTEIGCEDQAVMEQEGEILALLQSTGRWVFRDDQGTISLRDADGVFLLTAEPAA